MWETCHGSPWHHVDLLAFVRSQERMIVGGVVTAPLFGYLGHRRRETRSWLSALLVAGAVCFEPLARIAVGRLDPPGTVWAIEVAAGVSLAAYFLAARVTYRQRSGGGSSSRT